MEHSVKPIPRTTAPSPSERPLAKVIGLTGGIAAGKSTIAQMLADLGAEVIDADQIAHEVLESPGVCAILRREWGESVFGSDGHPDRAGIAERVFRNPDELKALNGWVHPPTCKEVRARLDRALRDNPGRFVVIDAPLLVEAELDRRCDVVLFVEADPKVRNARTKAARGWGPDEIARREAAQDTLSEKRRRANVIIDNNGSREETLAQVKRCFQQWTESVPARNTRTLPSGGRTDG